MNIGFNVCAGWMESNANVFNLNVRIYSKFRSCSEEKKLSDPKKNANRMNRCLELVVVVVVIVVVIVVFVVLLIIITVNVTKHCGAYFWLQDYFLLTLLYVGKRPKNKVYSAHRVNTELPGPSVHFVFDRLYSVT